MHLSCEESCFSAGNNQAPEQAELHGSAGNTQADEQAGITQLSWQLSSSSADMNHAAQ